MAKQFSLLSSPADTGLMDRALITGAAGFIGSSLVDRLLGRNVAVTGIDNFIDTYDPDTKRRNIAAALQDDRFTLIEADIRDGDAMDHAMAVAHPDAIIHLAALAGVRPSIERPSLYTDINLVGTTRLLDAAVKHGIQRFIFGSSSSVYGNNEKVPFSEGDRVDLPISPYAATKRAGELIAHTYHHIHGLPVSCLRFFTVYGPRQRPDLAICKFMRLIAAGKPIPVFGDGSTRRDYTYIDDIIDGVLAATDRCDGYDIINLGSHRPIALSDLIGAIERAVGRAARIDRKPMQPGDVDRTFADVTRAETVLGYLPKVSLDDGLAAQWRWLKDEFAAEGKR